MMRSTAILILLAALLASCTTKPALPKRASIEAAARRPSDQNFDALVLEADIIYFPSERAAYGGRAEPAAQLLDAMRRAGEPFAVGWSIIDAAQQPQLDAIAAAPAAARESLVGQLQLSGTGRAREHARAVLLNASGPAVRHVALGVPEPQLAKLRNGEALTPEEQSQLPRRFRPPVGGMEAFAERLSPTAAAAAGNLDAAYREHLLRQQFAAENIVRHFGGGGPGKMVVFMPAADLITGRGVPFYVAQRLQLRQLVLGSESDGPEKLLTRDRESDRSGLEVVDRAPRPAGD